MMIPDLNCDLGEHESAVSRKALMGWIDSANIACGGHAGNRDTMKESISLALEHQVRIGAHPGLADDGGRGKRFPGADELIQLLDAQVLPFVELVTSKGASLHHIKLHGTLYHATDQMPVLAEAYLEWCARHIPQALIYARSGGSTANLASERGITCWRECFLDRAYESDGSLRPRHHRDALLQDLSELQQRLSHWMTHQTLVSHDDTELLLACETFCLHGDGLQSLQFAQCTREWFSRGPA